MEFQQVKSNIPFEELFTFREVGYIDKLLLELLQLDDFSDYEFVIYFRLSEQRDAIEIPPSNKRQVIFIVSDESDYIPVPLLSQAFAVFRHYLPANISYPNLFPLPVGYSRVFKEKKAIPINTRTHSVFFAGNLHLGRANLYKYLSNLRFVPFALLHRLQRITNGTFDHKFKDSFIRFNHGFHTGMGPEEYANKLYNSKIVLCPHGIEKPETMRHFEAVHAGCVVISEKLPDYPWYKNSPIIAINNWKEAGRIILELLHNPAQLEELQDGTLRWWQTHFSEKAAARYVFNNLKKLEASSSK